MNPGQHADAYCAALCMYDWPEIREATDALWQQLKIPLREAGLRFNENLNLDRERSPMDIWLDPNLMLGQTCGFPYTQSLAEKTVLLGTPSYAVHGCKDGYYTSWILALSDDPRTELREFADSRLVINDMQSQSGCNALRLSLSALAEGAHANDRDFQQSIQSGFFSSILLSGAHRLSLRAVADERADLCAIDAVCLALARQHDPDVIDQLKIIGQSPSTPSLPLIMSHALASSIDVPQLQRSLKQNLSNVPSELKASLHLDGLAMLDDSHYQQITHLTRQAAQNGITHLAATIVE